MKNNVSGLDSLIDQPVVARVMLHNYRFPKDRAHSSGEFAIVILDVLEVQRGTIAEECYLADRRIVVSGRIPRLEDDMEYIFTGRLRVDPKWGPQYTCDEIHANYNMNDPAEQRTFLGYFLTERQINLLYKTCADPINLIRQHNLSELIKVKGIGPTTAERICTRFADNIQNSRAYVELANLGLTKRAIDTIVQQIGSADIAIDMIKANPYTLIRLVRGYGWERADRLALAQGFGRGCKERCLAYAEYKLNTLAMDEGNSRLPIDELLDELAQVCSPTDRAQIAEWIKSVTVGEQDFEQRYQEYQQTQKDADPPLLFYSKTARCIGLYSLRMVERRITGELVRLKSAPHAWNFDREQCEQIIGQVEAEQGYQYTHEQRRAIRNILDSNVSILTGSSGCGKSSTLKPLIRIFHQAGISVAQCALSGRASSLLTEYTGLEGKTIHRLLGYDPEREQFIHNARNPLEADVVILDETSMVGEELFLSLISSIKDGGKLLLLGDTKQLPPISVGNVLGDCIRSGYVPTNTLTIVQRQALKSGIVSQAIRVCEGKSIVKTDFSGSEIRGELNDFKLIARDDAALVHAQAVEEFKRLWNKGISADDIQIIVPVRSRGINSCRVFNSEIQALVNGAPSPKAVTVDVFDNGLKFEVTYKPGDRILVLKNNYHARTLNGTETAIFNGNMGHIVDLDPDNMIIQLQDTSNIIIPRESWDNIGLAYAVTCHKCQGSQAPYVIVSLDYSGYSLLMREWLYTALTRAQKFCALVGQPKAINLATRVSNVKVKNTWLKDELHECYQREIGVLV